jgi:hypothetical protein
MASANVRGPAEWRLLRLVLRIVPLPGRVLLVLDDTPTKRYGPKVEGADVHHNPTPGPAAQEFLYGHVWVTLSLAVRHSAWGALALPLRALLSVRQRTLAAIPKCRAAPRLAARCTAGRSARPTRRSWPRIGLRRESFAWCW